MLITKQASVVWNARNKQHYTQLGYTFTKMKDSFMVKTEDLTNGSQAYVTLRCDYCGREYPIQWFTYLSIKSKEKVHKDACRDCGELKCRDSIESVYGSYSGLHKETASARKATNIRKYGVENVFASKDIQRKISQTNVERYGVPHNLQIPAVRERIFQTNMQKYGVGNYSELLKGKYIKENSPVWKGGVSHSRVELATHEYIQWRTSVYVRDGYTCRCCGDKSSQGHSVELHAHHIRNWKDNKQDRYSTDNGITLCASCHYRFHSLYGKTNNTYDQLLEFLENN